ncbi:putative mitochondrial lectin [Leptomonas pyrrhocoris]|uniref:Putative mitochondrial lectin n=1 Tax=Leptomonas pyrrhocoris TaxID=157538 RepID=A0A0M9FUS0_LEPPY|nr:putative mitochondrial lectin [Leptomonas pyrrhocoris]XP_015654939.1 putative mitochondrial lectin [Leptomonas pyrrhocoris]KPA76499.1 putative mitochondrial lectin [Leptomonas pyrrhocoris]KPA76500.1 putative mitochondrial lectin [Leptomonas pyrrhocoris]|eukprot:XP_015654938.1 putative mitochondrial lectin [Leptomonas pyrrhocoris]
MPAFLSAALRGGRRGFWTAALFALVLALSACGLVALAVVDIVPGRTPPQQKRAVTTVINHHSFSPPLLRRYYGDGEIPHWMMSGTTVVTDNYVRLTGDLQSQTGHLWNTDPLDMDAFEIVFGFRVSRVIGGLGADGFALWVAQIPRFNGNIFGRAANFNGFGLLFDSYDNDNRRDNPMVSLVTNDGSATRRFTPATDFMGETLANCVFDFRNIMAPNMATARLRYNKGTLSLHLSRNSEVDEQHCFTVSNLEMPAGKSYLAFSGQTGDVSEVHDIIFVHLSPLDNVVYDHDVQQPHNGGAANGGPGLYDNDAMNNRRVPESTTLAPQQQQQDQQQEDQQKRDIEAQIRAEVERRAAELERDRLAAEQQRQQQQQQDIDAQQQQQQQQEQQQQQQQPPLDPAEADRQRIAELERKLAELKRGDQRRPERTAADDEYDEEYEDEDVDQPRRRRVRRARTPRRNTVEYED